MRLVHAADIHLDARSHSRPGPDGVPTALASSTACWLRACAIAVEQSADLMLVAGDVFHSRNPGALALNAFEAGLRLLKAARITAVIIDGNHDGSSTPELPSILAVFHDPVAGVYVSSTPEKLRLAGLRIGTLPWVSRQYLAAQHDGISRAGASEAVIEGLQRILDSYRVQGVDVVMGHWTVEGAQLQGSEIDVSITGEAVLPLYALEGFRYVAMGHIHKAQMLGTLPANYSGSTDRTTFGEEGEEKGCYVLDLDGARLMTVWHELPARRFVTIDFAAQDLDQIDVEGAIVRVRNVPDSVADRAQLVTVQSGAQVCYVETAPERHDIRRAADVTEEITPLAALDRWMELTAVPDEKRPAIRDAAKELVEG